jgi:hypothetical protein
VLSGTEHSFTLGWWSQMAASTKAACARDDSSIPPSPAFRYVMKYKWPPSFTRSTCECHSITKGVQ